MTGDMEQALDQAFAALRRGNLSELSTIYAMTETILSDLRITDRAAAARIIAKADRNAACLLAAARGVRSARRRLAELDPGMRMATYDSQGRSAPLGSPTPGLVERF